VVARPVAHFEPRRRVPLRVRLRDDRRFLRLKFLLVFACVLFTALLETP
jgi:hypothetical protein